ncbi:hypothetical protein SARC_08010 [Sphaeroforma arctica JP610]|uniref:Phosphatidylinositol transfer protein N-terminal domain-containing protein n=1 Tax=Sphaeroforma arctica JP610 TaxID=667725 RepID=A0A0L0FS82_9EUKA|nr:hypothetical protein SARC_08010 [Sphaeroforma arctica JP610]KNC79600.1 hypothetical protein SARC_08010 [Sphaeroforma arctica JP610]|eukprot:XP_014153502.1 hypothetical protein SARC_08010 [Sphaeroforma arctica JP610]
MLIQEYRVVMPLSVAEYKRAQTYMVAKHSNNETGDGEGFEFTVREACHDEVRGDGIYTEKKAYLSDKLGPWLKQFVPSIFFVCEKAWNYYPYTHTEYYCSFLPVFSIKIDTVYKDDNGNCPNALGISAEQLAVRVVDVIDVADPNNIPAAKKGSVVDLTKFQSQKTRRGPFKKGWVQRTEPVMCSYKCCTVSFSVWGMSNMVESQVAKSIHDLLSVVHAQAVGWIDEWIDLSEEEVQAYEKAMREDMNNKIASTAASAQEAERKGELKGAVDTVQRNSKNLGLGGQVLSSLSGSITNLSGSLSTWWGNANK